MELCKKVQAEEYVIHVEEATNFYTSLRFSLLASPWFPRPLGLALWSVLHMLLVLYMTLMLLAMFSIIFALAVWFDAFMLCIFVLVVWPWFGLVLCVALSILVISCNVPRREPGQSLANYILTVGGELTLTQTPPVEEQTAAACARACVRGLDVDYWQTVMLFNRLKLVSIPYWRVNLGSLCREIVPTYDAVVI